MDVELNVAYKPTECQQIILRIIKNEDTDNVALNVALNTKYLSDKIWGSRKTIQKSDESYGQVHRHKECPIDNHQTVKNTNNSHYYLCI